MLAGRTPSGAITPSASTAVTRYDLQLKVDAPATEEDNSKSDDEQTATEQAESTLEESPSELQPGSAEWRVLGELEYAIRLCILEIREEASHLDLPVCCCSQPGGMRAREAYGRQQCNGARKHMCCHVFDGM